MYLRNILVVLFSLNCFAADNHQKIPHDTGFYTCAAGVAVCMILYSDWKVQRQVKTEVDLNNIVIDKEGRLCVAFSYSPQQRATAIERQRAVLFGMSRLVQFLICPQLPFEFRHVIDPYSVAETALLPAGIYNATKPLVDISLPQFSDMMRSCTAGLNGLIIPHFISATGISQKRLVVNILMNHIASNQHNLYRDVAYVKQLTASLDYASKVMPLTQMAISRFYSKPSMLTLYPVMKMGEINTYVESMHAIVPVGVLAGVDLIFNAMAVTPVGTAISSVVDAGLKRAIQPLPKHMQRPFRRISKDLKQGSLEAAKIMTAVAILVAMEANGLKFA